RIGRLLDDAVQATRTNREGATELLVKDLVDVVEMHKGRGKSEEAARHLVALYEKLLRLRLRAPFWELAPFLENVVDPTRFSALMSARLPCDFVQEEDGDEHVVKRDKLCRFGPPTVDGIDLDATLDAIRTLQCQLHVFDSHRTALALASSDHAGGRCPFYSTCDLELRTSHADACRDAPWQIYSRAGGQGTCFYGAAVGGLLGLTVQKAE